METRANYILIGAFTIAGFIGLLAFFLWFARVELDRQFAYYDVKFSSVSGLSRASDVRFSGLPVGQVVNVNLSPDGDGTVLVRLEVRSDTPVRVGSIATIESQGVTGVSYVGISAGDPGAALLRDTTFDEFPQIAAGRSMLQSLSEDAPELVSNAMEIVKSINEVLGAQNMTRVENILKNVEIASEGFAQTLEDLTVVASSVSGFAIEISNFNVMLEGVTTKAEKLFATADTTLESITALAQETQVTMATGTGTLDKATTTLDRAEKFMAEDLRRTVTEVSDTLAETRTQIATLGEQARDMLAEFKQAGGTANARLNEAEATIAAVDLVIAQLNETLITMDKAAVDFDALVMVDGAALVAEARAALAPIAAAAQTDLPALVADIRAATRTANQVITDVGANLTAASGKIDGLATDASTAMAGVTDTFSRANETLTAVNAALAVGERTLAAAERTFDGADRVINEDIGAITADLRATISRFDDALAKVSADLPEVTADLRAASDAAKRAFEDVARTVAQSGGPIRDFTGTALPQFTRLANETRLLIGNLERLTRQLERDPARFLLGRQTPEYKR